MSELHERYKSYTELRELIRRRGKTDEYLEWYRSQFSRPGGNRTPYYKDLSDNQIQACVAMMRRLVGNGDSLLGQIFEALA